MAAFSPCRRAPAAALALGALGLSAPAAAQQPYEVPWDSFAPGWEISGANTVTFEHYDINGNAAASPFSFSGSHIHNDVEVEFNRQFSQFETLDGFFSGVINDSDYRENINGVIPERAGVVWRNGINAAPFQLELGDFFGFFSQRTFSGALKGAQLELQPQFGFDGWTSSIVLFGGSRLDNYREGEYADDMSLGASWLIGGANGGVALNYVHNKKDPDGPNNAEGDVASISYNRLLEFGDGATLRVDTEFGWHFDREAGGEDDPGFFARADGTDGQLTYSAMFEQYGDQYAPAGASVASNRRTVEGNVGWRFEDGLSARARLQHFRDQLEGVNPSDTYVAGLNLAGPAAVIGLEGWSFSTDAFFQLQENKNKTQDRETANLNLNLSGPLDDAWSMRASLLLTHIANNVNDDNGDLEQLTLGFTRGFEYDGFAGSFDLGGTVRHDDTGGQGQVDWGPNLSVNASKDIHSINASYSTLFQNPNGKVGDNGVHNLAASYRLTEGPHVFGVNGEMNFRDPRGGGRGTESFKLGLFYTFSFFKPDSGPASQPDAVTEASFAQPVAAGVELTGFQLGGAADDAFDRAADYGLFGAVPFPDGMSFEYPLFDQLSQRQRVALVLSQDRATLEKTVAVIDLDRVGDLNDTERLYDQIQATLAQQYGRPRETRVGDFSLNLAEDLAAGRFVRNSEWRVDGGVLRFGIPRRTDRVVRLEVQYARSLPPVSDPNWSVETLR